MSRDAPRLLNLGCGDRFHPSWTNLDRLPASPGVLRADLSRPLPFPDGSFEACYASHVLEHLPREEGLRLLRQIRRVLTPGGVVRLAVPDVERSVRGYLRVLEEASGGVPDAARHAWMLVELFDQMVRDAPGGEMAPLLATPDPGLRSFIRDRVGDPAAPSIAARAGRDLLRAAAEGVRAARTRLALALVRIAGGSELAEAFRAAVFRSSGEVHRAAYDRHALARALAATGFEAPHPVTHDESAIPRFAVYGLDAEDGRPRKPDSLFMEATSPRGPP